MQRGHPCFMGTELETSSGCSIPLVSHQLDACLKCALGGPGRIPPFLPFFFLLTLDNSAGAGMQGQGLRWEDASLSLWWDGCYRPLHVTQ